LHCAHDNEGVAQRIAVPVRQTKTLDDDAMRHAIRRIRDARVMSIPHDLRSGADRGFGRHGNRRSRLRITDLADRNTGLPEILTAGQ
jgi:hypothetical protein